MGESEKIGNELRPEERGWSLKLATAISLSALALPLGAAARAEEQPQAERGGIEEIVVTAQRREQSLQDVPIAVTAVTQETIRANRILTVNDLGTIAPNFTVRASAGGGQVPQFQVRGIFGSGVVPGSDKEISIYLDGVYLAASRGALFDLPDIARIEVLRGPQGTLFGRNSTAGAISITTREPSGEFRINQEFSVGNYDLLRFRTTADLPAMGPFSAYLSYVHDEKRGDIKNLGAGTMWDRTGPNTKMGRQVSPRYMGSRNNESFFASVKFEPIDGFKFVYRFDRMRGNFTPEGTVSFGLNRDRATLGASAPLLGPVFDALFNSQPQPITFPTSSKRPKAVNNAFATNGWQRASGHSLTADWNISDNLSLKNIAAYRRTFVTSAGQLDGLGGVVFTQDALVPYATFLAFSSNPGNTPAALAAIPGLTQAYQPYVGGSFSFFVTNAQAYSRQWSEEFQLTYDSDFLTLTAGGLYFHQKDRSGSIPGITQTFSFTPIRADGRVPLGNEGTSYNRATSIAGYGQAEVHLTRQLDAVAGLRMTRDKKSGTFVSRGCFIPAGATACLPATGFVGTGDYSAGQFVNQRLDTFVYRKTKPTYLIGFNYKADDDTLVYGKYSTGFVSGGAVGGIDFEPETVTSFEVGAKTDLLDRKVRLNAALFHAKYKNVQSAQSGSNVFINGVAQGQLGTVIITNGDIEAYGFEFESTVAPAQGLQFTAALGYTHAKRSNPDPRIAAGIGLKPGDFFPVILTPEWTGNLSAQYESAPVLGDARFFVRFDGNYIGKFYGFSNPGIVETIPFYRQVATVPGSWTINGRIALRDLQIGSMKAEIAAWARNLNNNRSQQFQVGFSTFTTSSNFVPARTFGLDALFEF